MLMKVQAELDETKIVLYDTIQSLVERDGKLDDLVYKSQDLSLQSKVFFRAAKKQVFSIHGKFLTV